MTRFDTRAKQLQCVTLAYEPRVTAKLPASGAPQLEQASRAAPRTKSGIILQAHKLGLGGEAIGSIQCN